MAQADRSQKGLWAALCLFALVGGCSDSSDPAHRPTSDADLTDVGDHEVALPEPDAPPDAGSDAAKIDTLGVDSPAARLSDAALSSSPDVASADHDPFTLAVDAGVDGPPAPVDTAPAVDATSPSKATVVVLPDTQYYAAGYTDVFYAQTKWIAAQTSLNVAAVLHVGDIVDSDNDAQWTVARGAMNQLDQVHIPYVIVPGNHDYGDINRGTKMDAYFPPTSMPWIKGMTPGQIENSYALLDIGPRQWLVLGLEFGPRDAVMAWADQVLSAYPDTPAIIVTHGYLYRDGQRYDFQAQGLTQSFIPQFYGFTASAGINDGEQIWQKLVLPHPAVRMVFCGHDTGDARLPSTRPDGSVVYQMLSDYQWYRIDQPDYYGGGGYLRVLQFDYDAKQVNVQTYSPYLGTYLTDDHNQFVIGLD